MEGTSRCCYDTQIVDFEGNYNVEGVKNFMTATNLSGRGRSYAVVAILGPQHGGKSTIMNHLFGTNFKQMDTLGRRSKTTDGIWIAKCAGIDDPFIVAMDVEGTDGKERGEDDTTFEKQSAIFALANADVVMINMWCHDLGREHAANKPLLKLVFEVMMRMPSPGKVTLLFVLRDKTEAEKLDNLKADVEGEIREIWDTAGKRHSDGKFDFEKYFRVEVVALSNYHDKKELFVEEVAQMKERYFGSKLLETNGDTLNRLPASEFARSTEKIWKDIKQNKDLDIPAHRVMVSTFRCKKIADEKFRLLSFDKRWLELEKAVMAGPVSGFGRKFRFILDEYLAQFDKEAMYLDEGISNKQRQELTTAMSELANSGFRILVANFRSKALEKLKNLFEDYSPEQIRFYVAIQTCLLVLDEACRDAAMELVEWDTSEAREDLESFIVTQLAQLQDSKLSEIAIVAKTTIARTLLKVIESSVEDGAEKMWECLVKDAELAVTEFAADVAHLGSGQAAIDLQMKSLRHHAKDVAERIVRKMAEGIRHHMKVRFERVFTLNDDGTVRDWTSVEGIDNLSLEARKESLKLLAAMAALRFSGTADNIHSLLISALIDGRANRAEGGGVIEFDPLACRKWAEVSSSDTLITPEECKRIWAEFINKTEYIVDQAKEKMALLSSLADQDEEKRALLSSLAEERRALLSYLAEERRAFLSSLAEERRVLLSSIAEEKRRLHERERGNRLRAASSVVGAVGTAINAAATIILPFLPI